MSMFQQLWLAPLRQVLALAARTVRSARIVRRAPLTWLVLSMLAAAGPAAAQTTAMVTIVDGDATLLDGSRNLRAAEGLKVGPETLIQTTARTGLLRVEWPDGTVADFGPDTQAMLSPAGLAARGSAAPAVYLLRGWVKLASLGTAPSGGVQSSRLAVPAFQGALVLMATNDETWAFAEGGTLSLTERDLRPASTVTLKNGEVYLRQGAAKGVLAARPTPAQMQRVPRGFRDSLPLRSASLKDKPFSAKAAPPLPYAELRDWLAAERPLRRNFTRRFADRLSEPEFRAGLAANLARHPEWEPVLFPERFAKPASAPR